MSREFWDAMYSRHHAAHGRGPNETLTTCAAALTPGTALDVACGEGADALWLAERGWSVTAVDVSRVALEHARARDAGQRVTWREADLTSWQPPGTFDLVTSHFLHLAPRDRPGFFTQLAAAVRPGGTLLFVAHASSERHGHHAELIFTEADVTAALDASRWSVFTERRGHELLVRARLQPRD